MKHKTAGVAAAAVLAAALPSLLEASFFDSLVPSQKFERMMREWTDGVRTNTTAMTSVRFRDEVLVPFVRREMPNPFAASGSLSGKPWASEACAVYEAGLRHVCGDYRSVYVPDEELGGRANALVAQGCDEPFILLLSSFAPSFSWVWGKEDVVKRLDMAQKAVIEYSSEVFIPVLMYPPTLPQVPVIVSRMMKLISTAS